MGFLKPLMFIVSISLLGYILGRMLGTTLLAYYLGVIGVRTAIIHTATYIAIAAYAAYIIVEKRNRIEEWLKNR